MESLTKDEIQDARDSMIRVRMPAWAGVQLSIHLGIITGEISEGEAEAFRGGVDERFLENFKLLREHLMKHLQILDRRQRELGIIKD